MAARRCTRISDISGNEVSLTAVSNGEFTDYSENGDTFRRSPQTAKRLTPSPRYESWIKTAAVTVVFVFDANARVFENGSLPAIPATVGSDAERLGDIA